MGFSVFHRLNSIGPLAQIIGRDRPFYVPPLTIGRFWYFHNLACFFKWRLHFGLSTDGPFDGTDMRVGGRWRR